MEGEPIEDFNESGLPKSCRVQVILNPQTFPVPLVDLQILISSAQMV